MKLPFPRTLKRNLTTLQIAQITSGVVLTNLYWITKLDPTRVAAGLVKLGFRSSTGSASASDASWAAGSELLTLATARAAKVGRHSDQCLESSGASLALHFNTAYLVPLVVLFARFFVRSYLRQQNEQLTKKRRDSAVLTATKKAADRAAPESSAASSTAVENGNGHAANGNGHANGNGKRRNK